MLPVSRPSPPRSPTGAGRPAYEGQRTATCPADLLEALSANPRARERFEQLDRTARYAYFLRLMKTRSLAERAGQLRRMLDELNQSAA
ncbi:YdeI/OmpD-associated family protein [Nocardia beijingensis]|uniref:YdeI/OmpD-associated family protein n=1 Tax=Nocardia beijingensis TaxID=95162 RepID=UPI00331D58FC